MSRNFLLVSLLLIGVQAACLAQMNINLIIQINEKIAVGSLNGLYIVFDSVENEEKFDVDYIPGDLIINRRVWGKINSDTTARLFLKFNCSTFTKKGQRVSNFFVELKRFHLEQRYLILNIYDFSDKKYRHWYQGHTDNDFLAELSFPGSSVYVRMN